MSPRELRHRFHCVWNHRSRHRNGWRNDVFRFLWEVRQKPRLGFLVSTCFVFLFEIKSACFADTRIVSHQKVLFTTHAHLDNLATDWACHFSIDNDEIGIGILKASEYHQQFLILLYTYHSVITTTPISRFQQMFHISQHSSADDDSTSWIKLNAQNELYWHTFIFFAVRSSTLGPFLSGKPDTT